MLYVWYVYTYYVYKKHFIFTQITLQHYNIHIPNCVKSASTGRGTDMDPFELTE